MIKSKNLVKLKQMYTRRILAKPKIYLSKKINKIDKFLIRQRRKKIIND